MPRMRAPGPRARVTRQGQLRKRAGKQEIPDTERSVRPLGLGDSRPAAAQRGSIDDVIVHKRCHVDQLDGGGGGDQRFVAAALSRRGAEHQQRAQALTSGGQRRACGR